MVIEDMNLIEVNERLNALETEVREMNEVADVEKATEEKIALLTRKAELEAIETRKQIAQEINDNIVEPTIVEERKEERIEMEEKKITVASEEYRSAFYAMISGNVTEEQRAVLATPISVDGDGTNDGQAIAIPKSLDEKIWDNIHTAHPVLADITTIASGVVLEVTKHTAIATRTTSKKDGAAGPNAEENTFVKVSLAGKDYAKFVELTYAEAKMSQGALEDYLADEIAAELGEALAKDVFAKMLSDAGSNKVTGAGAYFTEIAGALAKASQASAPVVYANSTDYYAILGSVDAQGQPIFRNGLVLNATLKLDNAATKITVVDPKKFVLNQIQGVMVESDKDVKNHRVVVSGYLRAEGCMRNNLAVSYID